MSKTVYIIRHVDCEGPGYLQTLMDRKGIPHVLVAGDEGQEIPSSTDDMLALVSMGGGMSVNDDLPWISREIALLQQAHDRDIPMLGHCLGAQLMAKALGAEVYANPFREIGWLEVYAADEARASPWLADLPLPLEAFHWHGETFSLPAGANRLLASEHCPNQAFAKGNMLAFQCHVEMTESLVREWVQRFPDQLQPVSATVQAPETILSDLSARIRALNKAAGILYDRWFATFT